MGSVSGRKRRANRDINGIDPSDTAVDEEATGEGLVAEATVEPREVGTDAVVPPTQAGDKFPSFFMFVSFCLLIWVQYFKIILYNTN